jgi:hypothetical protein
VVVNPSVVSVVGSTAWCTRTRFAFSGLAYTPYWVTTPTTTRERPTRHRRFWVLNKDPKTEQVSLQAPAPSLM